MAAIFKNNAYSALASGITDSATSITVATGEGVRFPNPTGADYFYVTLIDTSNNLEIVKCTARSTDTLTVVRAQEGTSAQAFSAGDRIEQRVTAAGLTETVSASLAAQTAAEAAQSATETIYDNFDDRYLGAKASEPATDNDGDALIDGAMYFNTTSDEMYVYDLDTTTWMTVSNTATSAAAAASAAAASASAAAAAAAAASNLFNTVSQKATADSPVTVVADTDDGTMFIAADDGVISFNLPSIATAGEGERYGFLRIGSSYAITLVRDGTDTINGVSGNYTMNLADGELAVLVADDASPDNWVVVVWTQVAAGNGLSKSGSSLSMKPTVLIGMALGAEDDAVAADTGIVSFCAPIAWTLTSVAASLVTAQTSGSLLTVDINEGGSTILSTELTFDNGAKTTATATTPAVLSDTAIAQGAEITVDVDQIGDGTAAGLKIYLIGYPV